MRRRDFLAGASAAALVAECTDADAQVTGRARLGWLSGARKQTDENSPRPYSVLLSPAWVGNSARRWKWKSGKPKVMHPICPA
jgi:hypothetical protein